MTFVLAGSQAMLVLVVNCKKSAIWRSQTLTNNPSDIRPRIKRLVTKKWQEKWDEYSTNKQHILPPSVSEIIQAKPERKDQVVLAKCQIGHSRLPHRILFYRKKMLPNAHLVNALLL